MNMDYQDYFWLNDAEKAKLAAACSSASDFGHIGLFSVGKAWKRHVEGMVGGKVRPENYLRAHNCAKTVRFGAWRNWKEVRALIRLTPNQALMMKLRHGGSDVAWVRDDPDGSLWGWLNVLNGATRWRTSHAVCLIERLLAGEECVYKPEVLVPYAALLPEELRAAFMWRSGLEGQDPNSPTPKSPETWPAEFVKRGQGIVEQHPDPAWHLPAETIGKVAARHFWLDCQRSAGHRRWLLQY
jgi:hypothetical protein